MKKILIPQMKVKALEYDVVVVGGGTGGVIAAIAASRQGAKTAIIESNGYVGGTAVEGGTALHSFFNNYKEFGTEKKQIIKGIPDELIKKLVSAGACNGYDEMELGYCYESVCTVIDVEAYKTIAQRFLQDNGVDVYLSTTLCNVVKEDNKVIAAIAVAHNGQFAFTAKSFIDCSGYGDLCGYAGATVEFHNDQAVANSMGVAGVDVEKVYQQIVKEKATIREIVRNENKDEIYRLLATVFIDDWTPEGGKTQFLFTNLRNNYLMFVKANYKLDEPPMDPLVCSEANLILREQQIKLLDAMKKRFDGFEHAFIARTAPKLLIRRGRWIDCDYVLTPEEICSGAHFEDDIAYYGFHDCAPRYNIAEGKDYGIPYRALLPKGLENVYATGMMISKEFLAHMSTRNTVSCMAQGEAAGVAAAMCAKKDCTSRELPFAELKSELLKQGVYLGD
ncbi:MAG: FAD-dependent oxidoreductase [Clostridia bacterium]